MPVAIVLAGPNGAGKTTFASAFLSTSEENPAFVNADEIAREAPLSNMPVGLRNIRAARVMLNAVDALADIHADFIFETTLATLTYVRKIHSWQTMGYTVVLLYLRLSGVEDSIARVRRRVQAGGHDIPEAIIRRRFARSLRYLEKYKHVVDEWYVWNSQEGDFTLAECWDDE